MSKQSDLEALRPWLTKYAKRMMQINSVMNWEDIAQEGWIAMWKAYDRCGEHDLEIWLKSHAVWRIKDVLRKHRSDMAIDTENEIWQIESGDIVDKVMTAYHLGQIRSAIDKLSDKQKEYILLRFYYGYQHPQLEEYFGYNPGSLWSSKKNGARQKLEIELSHLKELV